MTNSIKWLTYSTKGIRAAARTTITTTTTQVMAQVTDEIDHGTEHSWSEKAWPILAILAPLCITGFIANAIVVWVFVKWRILLNFQKINLFVVNLAVSNIAICVVAPPLIALPIFLAHTAESDREAIVSDMIYRVSSCFFGLASYANSFATTAIALHRRRMILKPRAQMKHERPQLLICFIMWGISLVLAVPELFRCATSSEDHDEKADEILPTLLGPYPRLGFELTRFSLQFLVASIIMIFSYISVFIALHQRSLIRAQFHDRNLKAHVQRLSSVCYKDAKAVPKGNAVLKKISAMKHRGADDLTIGHRVVSKPCATVAVASVAVTATTTLGNSSSGRPLSTSCETAEYVMTSGATVHVDMPLSPLIATQPSPHPLNKTMASVKTAWHSIKQKKFSASDSKNVCILIATVVVHFACWSPYNVVRLYEAIVEAINNSEEQRTPIAEGVVLCIAVSSVLHCPIFYMFYNRRNRHGLIACCAAIIPCRNSVLRRRLREMARKGNSNRYWLPLPQDTPPNGRSSPLRQASTLQMRFQSNLRRQSRSGILDELRTILYNAAQRRRSTTSQSIPPARHNSYNYNMSETGAMSPTGPLSPSSTVPPTAESVGDSQQQQQQQQQQQVAMLILNRLEDDMFTSFWQNTTIDVESPDDPNNNAKGQHNDVEKKVSSDQLQHAICQLAGKVSSHAIIAATSSIASLSRRHSCVIESANEEATSPCGDKEIQLILSTPSPTAVELKPFIALTSVRRTLSGSHLLNNDNNNWAGQRGDINSSAGDVHRTTKNTGSTTWRRHATMKNPCTKTKFLTVPQKPADGSVCN